jgi:hypothetical protein
VIFLFGLIIPNLSGAQVAFHCDKPYYVTGETIWYKAYFDNSIPEGSIISVKIVNSKLKKIDVSFLQVADKSISGFYKIPYDLMSDNYVIVLESKNSLGKNVRIGEIVLPLFNDIEKGTLSNNSNPVAFNPDIAPMDLMVNIQFSEQNVMGGDIVNVDISITDKNGNPVEANCSASVVDQGIIGAGEGMGVTVQQSSDPYNDLVKELFFEGKVYDENGTAIQANIMGAYAMHDNSFSFTKSAADGSFILPRNIFTGTKELQFVGYQFEHPIIQARMDQSLMLNSEVGLVRYNENIASYLQASSMRKKINQYFKLKDKAKYITTKKARVVLPETQANYNVQEYQDFENLAEFAKNLMMPLRFNGKKGERTAQVINPKSLKKDNYYLDGSPLFIIDGKLTRDADFVGSLEQSEIKELGITFDGKKLREKYNVMGSSGVVVINTLGKRVTLPQKDEQNIFKVIGIQDEVDYPVSYSIGSDMVNNPVFEPQLYWNPKLATTGSGKAAINYVQSNDRSTFRIIVVARAKDGRVGVGFVDYNTSLSGE